MQYFQPPPLSLTGMGVKNPVEIGFRSFFFLVFFVFVLLFFFLFCFRSSCVRSDATELSAVVRTFVFYSSSILFVTTHIDPLRHVVLVVKVVRSIEIGIRSYIRSPRRCCPPRPGRRLGGVAGTARK